LGETWPVAAESRTVLTRRIGVADCRVGKSVLANSRRWWSPAVRAGKVNGYELFDDAAGDEFGADVRWCGFGADVGGGRGLGGVGLRVGFGVGRHRQRGAQEVSVRSHTMGLLRRRPSPRRLGIIRVCPVTSESPRAAPLLPCHRDGEPVLGFDEVILAVVADIDLHPVDLAGELVAGGAVVR
jgi:hypothetical protein